MLERRQELMQRGQDEVHVMRVLAGTIILFDHACETGVFAKGSGIDVVACINAITEGAGEGGQEDASSQGVKASLVKAVQYTTIHWRDKKTPKKTIAAIEAATALLDNTMGQPLALEE